MYFFSNILVSRNGAAPAGNGGPGPVSIFSALFFKSGNPCAAGHAAAEERVCPALRREKTRRFAAAETSLYSSEKTITERDSAATVSHCAGVRADIPNAGERGERHKSTFAPTPNAAVASMAGFAGAFLAKSELVPRTLNAWKSSAKDTVKKAMVVAAPLPNAGRAKA